MKIELKKYKLSAAVLLCGIAGLNASWTLVDDFETGLDAWDMNLQADAIIDTYVWTADSGNKALWIDPNTYGVSWGEVYYSRDLGGIVGEGQTATFYYRVYMTGHSNNVGIGLTDGPLVTAVDEVSGTTYVSQPSSWGHFEAVMAISNLAEIRDGGRYAVSPGLNMIATNEWCEFWLVLYNTVGTSGDEYKVYFKTPSMAEPVLLQIPDKDNPATLYDTALFRNGTTDNLTRVMIVSHAEDPANPVLGEPVYWDDLYIDFTGENLTTPAGGSSGPDTWAGYDIDANGFIDTGDWLGWVYKPSDSDWVYVYDLSSWTYFPEPDAGSGGWSYVLR